MNEEQFFKKFIRIFQTIKWIIIGEVIVYLIFIFFTCGFITSTNKTVIENNKQLNQISADVSNLKEMVSGCADYEETKNE